jgi:hypothetical protein
MQVEHEKVWGLGGLPLESPSLLPHIGAAARKLGGRRRGGYSCASRWETGNFGLLQSVKRWL